jgi:excisionase family DNA binding protein
MSDRDTERKPEMLTTAEAAELLRLSPQTLREWSAYGRGPIRPIRVNGGRLLWPKSELEKLIPKPKPTPSEDQYFVYLTEPDSRPGGAPRDVSIRIQGAALPSQSKPSQRSATPPIAEPPPEELRVLLVGAYGIACRMRDGMVRGDFAAAKQNIELLVDMLAQGSDLHPLRPRR